MTSLETQTNTPYSKIIRSIDDLKSEIRDFKNEHGTEPIIDASGRFLMVGTADYIVIFREGVMNVREQYFTIRGAGKDTVKLDFAYDIPDEPIFDFDLPAPHRK